MRKIFKKIKRLHPVGFEPTLFFRSRIMSAVQSTTLPWMLCILKMNNNALNQIHPFDFFILLYGFLYGNLFAIHFSNIEFNFILIFLVVFFLEFVQKVLYFNFSLDHQNTFISVPKNWFFVQMKFSKLRPPFLVINTLKRGFLLGFFLEAFKVGS